MHVRLALVLLPCLAVGLTAQRFVVPEEYTKKDAESLEITPIGWERIRCTQYLGPRLLQTKLPFAKRITEIAFRRDGKALPGSTLQRPAASSWSIRMANYIGNAQQPSTRYLPAGNSTNQLSPVFQKSSVQFPNLPPVIGGLEIPFSIRFKLDRPFIYLGAGLAIDHFSYGARSVGYYYLVDAVRKPIDSGSYFQHGASCPSNQNRAYAIPTHPGGPKFELVLLGGPQSAPAVAFLGASRTQFGGLQLPFDLRPLGLAGCFLHASMDLLFPLTTYTGGGAKLALEIPGNPSFAGLRFFGQWLAIDSRVNPSFPLAFSNGVEVTLGRNVGKETGMDGSLLYGAGGLARSAYGFVDPGVVLVMEVVYQ